MNATHFAKNLNQRQHTPYPNQTPLYQQLEENLSLLESTLECTTDGILVVDTSGQMVRYNHRFLNLWRIPQNLADTGDDNLLLSYVLDQLLNPDAFITKVRQLYAQPELESFDELNFKDGRVFERYSKPQLIGGRVVGRVWSFRDITLQKNAERELNSILNQEKQLRIKAQDTVKLRDEFLAIATHELKTPLTPLLLIIQRFKKALPHEHVNPRMFDLAINQIIRLEKLVDDLLDVSRIATGSLSLKHEDLDLTSLILKITDCYATDLKNANCEVKLQLQENVIGVWDHHRIEQVIINLLCNAMKFGKGKPIILSLHHNSKEAVMTIQDFGIGIQKEDQDRIFKRFERAVSTQQFDGLGLGLYIVHQIVMSHRGSIKVESEVGKGSKFIVTLPLVHDMLSS